VSEQKKIRTWIDALAKHLCQQWQTMETESQQVATVEQDSGAGECHLRYLVTALIRQHVDLLVNAKYAERSADLVVKVWIDGGEQEDIADIVRGAIVAAKAEMEIMS
jgi:hypothetical protein